jgi:hypothetical protein
MIAIISAVLGVIGMLIAGVISLTLQLIPALFQLCISIERCIFMVAAQLTNRLLNTGLLTLISGVVWAVAAALVGTPLLSAYFGTSVALWLLVAGGLWGTIIGHQAAILEYANQLRQPGVLRHELPGSLLIDGMPGQYTSSKSLEELLAEGSVLGEVSPEDE